MLQPLDDEKMAYKSANIKPDARSDVRIRRFWTKRENALFDFRVFYPHAKSYRSKTPAALYRQEALRKKREYEQRICEVEGGSFTPMIMSSSGCMGPEMQIAIKHLARKLADKKKQTYSEVVGLLRCRFAFAMVRSAIICLRGSRSLKKREFNTEEVLNTPVSIVAQEARICV